MNTELPDPFPGEFRLRNLLGEGTFGRVWLADDLNLGRQVAVKALRCSGQNDAAAQGLHALRRDAQLLAKLHHPNIVQVHAWRTVGNEHYLILQYVPGGSLADRVAHEGPLPWEKAVVYVADVGRGLIEVHACGIVHRDIKPGNILWDPDRDQALLTDFGVSAHLALAQTIAGTPSYMPPEAFRGKVGEASDVYGLTVTLFYLVTGKLPFSGSSWDELLEQVEDGLLENDPRCAGLPQELEQLLRAGLRADPQERISLANFVRSLRRLVNPQALPEEADSDGGRTPALTGTMVPGRLAMAAAAAATREPRSATTPERTWRAGPEPPGRRKWPLLVVLLAALATGGFWFARSHTTHFELVVPRAIAVRAGEETVLAFRLQRSGVAETLEPLFAHLPAGVQAEAAPLVGSQSEGSARIRADLNALPGTSDIALQVRGRSGHRQATIALTVQPAQPWLPEGFAAASAARLVRLGKKTVFDRIVCQRHSLEIPLVLIPKLRPDDPPSFYVMDQKVSNGQFRRFAEAQGKLLENSQWQRGGLANRKDLGATNDQLPVLRVTFDEAWQFAVWMGGRLPTAAQWDKAAGRFDDSRATGPYLEPWNPEQPDQIGVGRSKDGPLAVGTATHDVSRPFGLHDMAGNGREWTRTSKDATISLPLARRDEWVGVVLRGRSYREAEPLRFEDLDNPLREETQSYDEASPYTGFRVVVDQLPVD